MISDDPTNDCRVVTTVALNTAKNPSCDNTSGAGGVQIPKIRWAGTWLYLYRVTHSPPSLYIMMARGHVTIMAQLLMPWPRLSSGIRHHDIVIGLVQVTIWYRGCNSNVTKQCYTPQGIIVLSQTAVPVRRGDTRGPHSSACVFMLLRLFGLLNACRVKPGVKRILTIRASYAVVNRSWRCLHVNCPAFSVCCAPVVSVVVTTVYCQTQWWLCHNRHTNRSSHQAL